MEVKRDILWRVYLSFLGIVALTVFIIGRAAYIQNAQGSYWRSMSDSLHQRIVPLDAERGTIYSEDGEMLSTSLPTFDIYIDFGAEGLREKNGKRFRENVDSFSLALANYFGDKTKSEYKRELQIAFKRKDRYFLLKKKLSFAQYKSFREFPLARLGRNRSGVIAEVKGIRKNPYGLLANRTIGLSREYIASNGKVKTMNVGLENTYDTILRGQSGSRLVRFIAGGAAVPVEGYEIEPENGKDIITTLDVNMQDIAETALMKMMVQSESLYGTCVVMEVKTGKIKAIANLGKRTDGSYWEDYNYALRTTEPGSTIKLATLLSVLEEGKVKITDRVEVGTAGSAFVGVRNVNDAERSPKSMLDVKEAFAHSSNVGMSKLAFHSFSEQPDRFINYLKQYRLDQPTGIDLLGEEKPQMVRMKRNKEGLHGMVTVSFGYAIEVSPLQTLMLYNAVANNGTMMRPYLVNNILQNGLVIKNFLPQTIEEKIARDDVIASARSCMEAVVTEGTAKTVFADLTFPVAGKTGTAHVADGSIKYTDGVYQASFAGYFPADKPEYSCIVVIRTKPHAAMHYGGQLAAPVFKEVAIKLYGMYVEKKAPSQYTAVAQNNPFMYAGSTPDMRAILGTVKMNYSDSAAQAPWSTFFRRTQNPVMKSAVVKNRLMPDIRGMGLKDVLYLLENMGLKVSVNGKGKVISQSVHAGVELKKGMTVYVELG